LTNAANRLMIRAPRTGLPRGSVRDDLITAPDATAP
jgi:hypothetical protein